MTALKNEGNGIPVKPYSNKELAAIYGVHPDTFRTWVDPHREAMGKRIGIFYTVKQVEYLFDKLKLPYSIKEDEDTYIVRPYTTKEMAAIYGKHPDTFRTWIAPFSEALGERIGVYFTIPQVEYLFDKLGLPYIIKEEDDYGKMRAVA